MNTRPSPTLALCVALAAGVLFGLTGCGRHETRVAAGTRDGVLHLGNGAEPKDLDPNTQQAAVEWTIISALFEGLVVIAGDGEKILPGVAERWEISPDGLVYTFHLRRDARWSDGTPVTADDFLFSFRRVFNPGIAAAGADYGYAIAGAFAYASGKNPAPESLGLRAPDPYTFEITLGHPAPYILFVLGGAPFTPVPRHVIERFGGVTKPGTAWTKPGNLVSNGPFQLKSWQANADVTVVKNPHYWDRAHVRLNAVRFYPTDNGDAEERSYRAGDLHITYKLPITKFATYAAAKPSPMHVTPLLWTDFLVFNTAVAPFNNVLVRRAFALATDRERLTRSVLHEAGTTAHSFTRPGTGGYTPPVVPDYDPALARRLLAEAGFPDGKGFPRVEFLNHPASPSTEIAAALQQFWRRELGVQVEIVQQESKVMLDALKGGKFQVAQSGYFYGIQAAEFILMLARGGSSTNNSKWQNAGYDAAFAAAESARTEAVRHAALDTMERLIQAEAPYSPLFFSNQCILVHPDVHGWRDNPLYAIDWRDLWLEGTK